MKAKTRFYCTTCGNETAKWAGKCPACGSWNTLEEVPASMIPRTKNRTGSTFQETMQQEIPTKLTELDAGPELRFSTGMSEFDRVLGGGAVRGSLVLVGGAPGIGKSTLLLQMCGRLRPEEKILYVTGEESKRQLKLRADRLGVQAESLFVLAETDLVKTIHAVESLTPALLIIDSVQTLYNAELTSPPGSITQVKDCTLAIMQLAKRHGLTAFIVGHVNKDGAIAGPKVLEHMVDCVLYFEGDRSHSYRILRAAKNRFGSTNEIGVFEMAAQGLQEVPNPSEAMLSGRPDNASGTCVTCVLEGTRSILAEVQALVTPSGFASGRRNANGVDYNRAQLLLAVLEKRGGMALSGCDAYINVIGGLSLDDPAADLAITLALASSFRDCPIGSGVAAIGEVGLTGEVRGVSAMNQRLAEIARLGFQQCIIPAHTREKPVTKSDIKLIAVKNIREAIDALL